MDISNNSIGLALQALRPGATWNIRGETLSGIEWLDANQVRPTDEEITARIASYVAPPTIQDQISELQGQVKALLAAQGQK